MENGTERATTGQATTGQATTGQATTSVAAAAPAGTPVSQPAAGQQHGREPQSQAGGQLPGNALPGSALPGSALPGSALPPELVVDEQPLPAPGPVAPLREVVAKLIRGRVHAEDSTKQNQQQADSQLRSLFLNLLRVLDAFDRIERATDLASLDDAARHRYRSVKLTATLLEDVLDEEDVVPMRGLVGKEFDSRFHEAAIVEDRADCPDGTILDVRERGYLWRNRLLRRAKVVVSQNT